MKLRKELWFGFTLMALIIAAALGMLSASRRSPTATSDCSCCRWWWWRSCWAFPPPSR